VREIMSVGAPVWIRATGVSMMPAIRPGTKVRLVPAGVHGVQRGDVLLAVLPDGRAVLHRVRAVSDESITLRGDACVMEDPPIVKRNVVARADMLWHGQEAQPIARRVHGSISLRARRFLWTLRRRLARVGP
jgi:hypothetical protein